MAKVELTEDAHTSLLATAEAIVQFIDNRGDTSVATSARDAARKAMLLPAGVTLLGHTATALAAGPQQLGKAKGAGGTGIGPGAGGIRIVAEAGDVAEKFDPIAPVLTNVADGVNYAVHIHLHLPKA